MGRMQPQHGLFTIGELARRTGLPVKTIRFYADEHIVPPTTRNSSGYRLYDAEATARLDLVRTLRDLGIGLGSIRRILAREADLGEVAAAHADALDAQIRVLRTRRAVLRTVAHTDITQRDLTLMNKLARLSAEERRRIIDDYHDAVLGGLDLDEGFESMLRSARVDLPDDPTAAQVDAWVELAELVQDPDYRAAVRAMAERQQEIVRSGAQQQWFDAGKRTADLLFPRAKAAVAAGTAPDSAAAAEIIAATAPEIARIYGVDDTPQWRASYADDLDVMTDTRSERYWELLGVINGWAPFERGVPAMQWFITALRANTGAE